MKNKLHFFVSTKRLFHLDSKRIKKKRFLLDEKLDEKLDEIKVRFNISVSEEYSFEILVLNHKAISEKQFQDFKQKQFMQINLMTIYGKVIR